MAQFVATTPIVEKRMIETEVEVGKQHTIILTDDEFIALGALLGAVAGNPKGIREQLTEIWNGVFLTVYRKDWSTRNPGSLYDQYVDQLKGTINVKY